MMRNLRTLIPFRNMKSGPAMALVALVGLVAAPLVNATPITFYNDASVPSGERFTLGCGSASGDCSGLLEALIGAPGVFDSSAQKGDLFDVSPSSDATELAFVNANTLGGTSFSGGAKTNGGGASNVDFATSADYFLLKIGFQPSYAMVHNVSGTSVHLFFTQTGKGAGLSHYSEFGDSVPVSVPEPAALGMFGFGALLVGLLAAVRRRRCV